MQDERLEAFIRRLDGVGWFDVLAPEQRRGYLLALRESNQDPPFCLPGHWTSGEVSECADALEPHAAFVRELAARSWGLFAPEEVTELRLEQPGDAGESDDWVHYRLTMRLGGATYLSEFEADPLYYDEPFFFALRILIEECSPELTLAVLNANSLPSLLVVCGRQAYAKARERDLLPPTAGEIDEEDGEDDDWDDDDDPADAWKRGEND